MVETAEKSFDDFYLSDEMLKALRAVGYKRPTPVQVESIPLILAGIDLIVQSQTGSGKTAAFAIPTIEMLEPHPGRVEVLTLAPTRELAKQVAKEFNRLGQFKELSATAIYGGASYEKQYEALETAQLVAATPGRLLDLAKRGAIDLSNLRIFCLDEADEMLSMGFREELNAIVEFLPEERQSLLFSATVDEAIKSLSKGMLYYPEYISLSGDNVAAEAVSHTYYRIQGVGRERDLVRVLEYESPDRAIIFANTRANTFTVTKFLKRHGYRAKVLNGELPQKKRERTLAALRNGEVDFIVATDVAARGIDVTDLSHVFNYELPSSAEVYVHRTGRTGRAGKSGRAVSLVSPAEMATHFDLMTLYDIDITHRELPSADEIVEAQEHGRLQRLTDAVMGLSRVPYGGKLGMARTILEAGVDDDADDTGSQRVRMLAKLLSMADTVVNDDDKRDVLTGRATLASSGPARTPEAPSSAAPGAQSKSPSAKKRAPSKGTSSKNKPSKRKRSTANSSSAKPAPKPSKPAGSTSSDQSSRRRTRSRGAQKRSSKAKKRSSGSKKRPSGSNKHSSGSKKRSSSGAKKRSSGASKRSSGSKKRRRSKSSQQNSDQPTSSSGGSKRKRRRTRSNKNSNKKQTSSAKSPSNATPKASSSAAFETSKMYMNVGRDHFDGPAGLLEMICFMSGFSDEDFGKIVVKSSYSFVQVRKPYFYDIINAINNQEWNDVRLTAEPARK